MNGSGAYLVGPPAVSFYHIGFNKIHIFIYVPLKVFSFVMMAAICGISMMSVFLQIKLSDYS